MKPFIMPCIFLCKEIDWPLKLEWDELQRCFNDRIRFSDVLVVRINCAACVGPQCHENCFRPCSWAWWWPSRSDGDDTDSCVHLGTSTHLQQFFTEHHCLGIIHKKLKKSNRILLLYFLLNGKNKSIYSKWKYNYYACIMVYLYNNNI